MLCLLEATGLAKAHPAKQLKSASSYAPAGSLSGAFHGHAACGRPLLRLPPPLGRRRRRRSRAGPRVGREAEVAAQGDVHEGLRAARRAQKVAVHFSAGRALRVCSPAPCEGCPLQVRVLQTFRWPWVLHESSADRGGAARTRALSESRHQREGQIRLPRCDRFRLESPICLESPNSAARI